MNNPLTQQAIADALGITRRRVGQLKADGMPTHSIRAAQDWRKAQETASAGTGSAEELRIEKIKLTIAQREKIEFQTAIEKGRFISREFADDHANRIGTALNAACQKLTKELPTLLLGQPLSKGIPIAKREIHAMQAMLADQQSEFWKAIPKA
jgi:phage terminase Nu1 subunit (DNA packaging protein)